MGPHALRITAVHLAESPRWYVVCRSTSLRREPLARTVLGTPLAVFRTGGGLAAALLDRCPHRNAPLSHGFVDGDAVRCPYHGWAFGPEGRCRHVPGLLGPHEHPGRDVSAFRVVERDGLVWVRGGSQDGRDAPPVMPLMDQRGTSTLYWEREVRSTVEDAAENLLDGTHTHFVHGGLIQREARRHHVEAIVRRGPDFVEAEYVDTEGQSGLIMKLFGAGVDRSFGRFLLPGLAQLEYRAGDVTRLIITAAFTPTEDGRVRAYGVATGRAGGLPSWLVGPLLRPFFSRVLDQDARMLELARDNVDRFGGPRYAYTELDLLRPHIHSLLAGRGTDREHAEKRVALWI